MVFFIAKYIGIIKTTQSREISKKGYIYRSDSYLFRFQNDDHDMDNVIFSTN